MSKKTKRNNGVIITAVITGAVAIGVFVATIVLY